MIILIQKIFFIIMFAELMIACFAGVLFGIFTGITPGIHINLVCVFLLGASHLLLQYFSPVILASFIVAMSITHTFLDILPSVFLGAPEEATALIVLPGHKLLLQGLGFDAVKLTIIGSFFGLLLTIALSPILMFLIKIIFRWIEGFIAFILIAVIIYMIIRDKRKISTIIVVVFSGILGVIVLSKLHMKEPLLPLLSGLFGMSIMISGLSESSKIPEQKRESIFLRFKSLFLPTLNGVFAGFMTGFLPGMGASQGAIIASQFDRKIDTNRFLITCGAIGTVNMVISLLALYVINKARNGSVVAVSKLLEINLREMLILFGVCLVAGGVASILSLKISRFFARIITRINYKLLTLCIIFFITIIVFCFSGLLGLVVLAVSTFIGYFTSRLNIGRNHLMASLMVPVILYYFNII